MCRGPECGDKRCSRAVYDAFARVIEARRLVGAVTLEWQSCFGRCTQGPNVLIREIMETPGESRFIFAAPPRGRGGRSALYNGVTPDDALELIDEHVVRGRLVRRLIELPARTQSRPVPGNAGPSGGDDP